jgi:[ribosomal protein S5]-alanine N-acetyltransferase
LLPGAVDDYVEADNSVRFIDAFIDRLDLAVAGSHGSKRPGYAPGDLLKLYIYGYLNRVRSSRLAASRRHGVRGEMAKLETDRLLIREVLASDADDFLRYRQQDDYWRHVPIEPPTTDSIATLVNGWTQNRDQNPRTVYFLAATDKRSNQLVGDAGLYVRSIRSRQGEIGWGVVSSQAGQGFATEIGQAFLRLAFDSLSLHRVFAQCRVGNQASRRIMAKLGMREEGVFREKVFARGEWWSLVQSSILSAEWSSATKAE